MVSGTMKAAVLEKPGKIQIQEKPIPEPKNGEVLIKVMAAGVCGSDIPRILETGAHTHPLVMGHEFSGQITEVGKESSGFQKGDRVTAYPLIPCRKCKYCRASLYNLCENYSYLGSRQDGAFAQFVTAPSSNLVKLPSEVDFDEAAATDPAAIALHGLRKVNLHPGERVAVLGAGPIGLFSLQWAKALGASQVLVTDLFDEKLAVAHKLGADEVINVAKKSAKEIPSDSFDVLLETTAVPQVQAQSLSLAKPLGRVGLIGISHKPLQLSEEIVDGWLRKELKVIGVWNSLIDSLPTNEWVETLNFMSRGIIKVTPLITHRYPIDKIPQTFEMIENGDQVFIKIMFFPNGEW